MKPFFALILFALIAVKVTAMLLRGPVPLELDAFGYWHLSTLVMQGDVLMLSEPIAYRTPIYPWFLATIRTFADHHSLWFVSLVQGGLWLGAIGLASRLAFRITRLPLAPILTLIALLPPVAALTYSTTILSESVFVFLLMLNLSAVVNYGEKGGVWRAVWVGVTFAVLLLTRPVVQLLWVPHLIYVVLMIHGAKGWSTRSTRSPVHLHHLTSHGLIALIVVGLLCTPWLVRNEYLFDKPFLTEFLGRNLWIVAFQDESGTSLSLPDTEAGKSLQTRLDRVGASQSWQATWAVSDALVRSGLRDPEADRLMKEVAVDAIQTNPKAFLYQAFRRCVNFWRCAATDLPPQGTGSGPYYGQAIWKRSIPTIQWAVEHRWSQSVMGNTLLLFVMIISLLILILNPPTRPQGLWLALILAYFSIVTGTLEIPAYRYRMVLEPIVGIVIGSSAAVVLSWRRREAKLVKSD